MIRSISEEDFLILEEEAKNSCSPSRDTYLASQHRTLDLSIPEEDPLLWDTAEHSKVEALASLFSLEYMHDWNAEKALIRMGADTREAKKLAPAYLVNTTVNRFIKRRKQRFFAQNNFSAEQTISWMSQDASDFSMFANPIARTKAQQALWQAQMDLRKLELQERKMALEETIQERLDNEDGGGVLVVPGIMDGIAWEETASECQDLLKS